MLPLEHLLNVIVDAQSGIVNRQIEVINFIRVVILDPPIKDHVIQCMSNPKTAIFRYVQLEGRHMILQVT